MTNDEMYGALTGRGPQAGHRPRFEQPDHFAATMRAVLAETGG